MPTGTGSSGLAIQTGTLPIGEPRPDVRRVELHRSRLLPMKNVVDNQSQRVRRPRRDLPDATPT
jgi:hypothetical protein